MSTAKAPPARTAPAGPKPVSYREALTQAILGARARGAIVVVVAHRPNVLSGVDHVLALNGGRQQAFGPRDEVLAKVLRRDPVVSAPKVVQAVKG